MSITIDGISYGLSATDLADRKAYLNASEAPTICAGDAEKRYRLWQEKTGRIEPEDLSENLLVQFGSYSEALNIYWFERQTGLIVTDRQSVLKKGYMRATLDGMTIYRNAPCVVEAKFMSAYSKFDERIQYYMSQVHVQMYLSGTRQAIITVIQGTPNYEWVHVEFDDDWWAKALARLEMFHECVLFDQPPHDLTPLDAPKPSTFKPYDFTGQNEWASHAADWLATKAAADTFKAAEKNIKALVPEDASEVTGHAITVKRSKAGALTIKGDAK